ncbi:hypothetical protein [Halorussus salinisoli]|uniref:hypothetical protein n=1 Tax=Halorussus salinisoli TaxID=2558242 RepID=UPI00148581C5|nr:hypothetical protein [Halorussus salinisoli]
MNRFSGRRRYTAIDSDESLDPFRHRVDGMRPVLADNLRELVSTPRRTLEWVLTTTCCS